MRSKHTIKLQGVAEETVGELKELPHYVRSGYKVRLTAIAEKRFNDFKNEVISDLEDMLAQQKAFPGETDVEITASDVENLRQNVRLVNSKRGARSRQLLMAVAPTYSALGLLISTGALFYPQFEKLLLSSTQKTFFAVGGVLLLVGLLLQLMIKVTKNAIMRDEEEQQMVQRLRSAILSRTPKVEE